MRLHVNIDHIATLRNARGTSYPDPVWAAGLCELAGAHGITVHLREDRRHIKDRDVELLRQTVRSVLNLEMAVTPEMLAIARRLKPDIVTLVPEKREERTTEGGLDIVGGHNHLLPFVQKLKAAGIRVSLFIEAAPDQIEASAKIGADIVELHTGAYCERALEDDATGVAAELAKLSKGATLAAAAGLEVHAGHGLTFNTVAPVARLPEVVELNIGHFLIGEAIFGGLHAAVKRMRLLMEEARMQASGRRSA